MDQQIFLQWIYGIDLHKIYIVMRQKALEAAVSVARAETTPPVSHCLARRVEKIRPNAVPFFIFILAFFGNLLFHK